MSLIVWSLIPARGGSKSIPLKNMTSLGGRPLLDYCIRAALACRTLDRNICSTDHEEIAKHAHSLGVEVDQRPASLGTDDAKVDDVARDLIMRKGKELGTTPDILVLLQPTSPFVTPEQITQVITLLSERADCRSAQTVARVPHNLNAINHRSLDNGIAKLKFEEERRKAYNKQLKEQLFYFANLYAIRCDALMDGEPFFAPPSAAIEVPQVFAYDLDGPDDIQYGEAILNHGSLRLDHLG